MAMKQAIITKKQWPFDAEDVLVNVLDDDGRMAIVKTVDGSHPFTSGDGDAIFRHDLVWYAETKIASVLLREVPSNIEFGSAAWYAGVPEIEF